MTVFFIGVILFLLLAFVCVLYPVLLGKKRAGNSQSAPPNGEDAVRSARESTNIALYRDHLADLDESLSAGNITQEQYDELKIELERNLLEDSDDHDDKEREGLSGSVLSKESGDVRKAVSILSVSFIALVVCVGGIYSYLGSHKSWVVKSILDQRTELEQQYISTNDPQEQQRLESQVQAVNQQLIAQLSAYVQDSPEDLQMRAVLARTGMTVGNYGLAVAQFRAILEYDPELTQIMAELAQAVFLQADNRVVPIVQRLADSVLEKDPNNTIALGLSGIGAFQSEKYEQAIDFWQKAIQLQGPNSPNSIALQRGISAAQQRLAATTEEPSQQAQIVASDAVMDEPREPSITVSVSLGEAVDAAPNTTVFIYARAWQGSKAPLSIARLQVQDLPTTLTLTNAMSMAPSMNLSTASEVELVARISGSGTPVPQSGDWQVTLGPIATAKESVTQTQNSAYSLLIEEQIP